MANMCYREGPKPQEIQPDGPFSFSGCFSGEPRVERSCENCEHRDEGIDPYCNKLYQHCPKVVAGWHCSDWEEVKE